SVVECWVVLAQDPVLSADLIQQFINIIHNSALYNEHPDRDRLRIAAPLPLAAVSALHEMLQVATMEQLAVNKFAELLCVLLIVLGCYVGTSPPINTPHNKKDKTAFIPNRSAYKLPGQVTMAALNSLLLLVNCDEVLTETGDNMTYFLDIMPPLTRVGRVSRMPQSVSRLVTCLNQYNTSCLEPQRITVVAFYAELVSLNANGQAVLLESIISSLLNCLNDPCPVVRRLCLKGLASIPNLAEDQKSRHYQPILSALIQGLDDHDTSNNIALEAMRGFSRILNIVDVEHIQGVQATVALRIKPFFEKENAEIREAAFLMFGDLAKCGGTDTKTAFQEQITGNLVCLLLHLEDNSRHVVKACKYALRQAGPLLGAERINAMLQDHLIDVGNLNYPDFIADLVKKMVEEMPDLVPTVIMNALVYVKSSWPVIRGNAAMFIGHVYSCVTDSELVSKVPQDMVSSRLIQLLHDEDQRVRAHVAKSLSYLIMV
ncbi:hypothetical protein L9F63_012515, partial [Diploptera punctata]